MQAVDQRHRVHPGFALLAAPVVALAFFKAFPSTDREVLDTGLHFWSVGVTALAAAVACAIVVGSARSLRETRLLFLALAFISIGGIFSVHGLLTPGVVVHEFHAALAVSSWASVIAGSTFVALSAMTMPESLERAVRRAGGAIFAWACVAIAVYVGVSFAYGSWLDWAPTDEREVQYAVAIATTGLFGFGAVRYWQAYQFARLPSQGAMVVALVLLAQVPAILLWGEVWYTSWWMYHVVYGLAFCVLFAGWAIEVQRAGSLKVIAEGLSMRDALAQLARGQDAHVLELVDAIEAKDVATLGHVRRVSAYALAIGRRLGLSPAELRSLAIAADLHDVGKIGVPDSILGKPGKLTEQEFAEMQRHTGRGYDIATRIGALREIAPVIRAHHERMNGSGYPDALRGEEIPMAARIIAVADSYDAMTSHRPYRGAMTHGEAVKELQRVSGVELDARCVEAFLQSLDEGHAEAA
jgi:HD-GYP domain-containing protein (c-di-GMP phosphodiesterase class II)